MPSRTPKGLSGDRYHKKYLEAVARNRDITLEFEDYAEEIHVDHELGLRLYHTDLNYEDWHFRHRLLLLTAARGKAARVHGPNKIIARVLSATYHSKAEICAALKLSLSKGGSYIAAGDNTYRSQRCVACGHQTRSEQKSYIYHTTFRMKQKYGWRNVDCCSWDESAESVLCCDENCKSNVVPFDPQQALASLGTEPAFPFDGEALPIVVDEGHQPSVNDLSVQPIPTHNNVNGYGDSGQHWHAHTHYHLHTNSNSVVAEQISSIPDQNMLDEGYGYNNAQVEEIPDTMDISATNQTVELTRDGEVGAVEEVGGVVGVHNSQF